MDSKESKLYYFIQLELLRLKHLTKFLEKSNLQGIRDYLQRTLRVVRRAKDPQPGHQCRTSSVLKLYFFRRTETYI